MYPENNSLPPRTVVVISLEAAKRERLAHLADRHGVMSRNHATVEHFLDSLQPSLRGCVVFDLARTASAEQLADQVAHIPRRLPVLGLSDDDDLSRAVAAMQSGALTVLPSHTSDDQLWEQIVIALEREQERFGYFQQLESYRERRELLTQAEQSVLEGLLAGKPNKTIAAELDIGLRTVELRRSSIMHKLQVKSLAALVREVTLYGTCASKGPGLTAMV